MQYLEPLPPTGCFTTIIFIMECVNKTYVHIRFIDY